MKTNKSWSEKKFLLKESKCKTNFDTQINVPW